MEHIEHGDPVTEYLYTVPLEHRAAVKKFIDFRKLTALSEETQREIYERLRKTARERGPYLSLNGRDQ